MFAILLILNACGSHETPAPAEPSEPSETLETTETTEDTETMDSSESSEPSEASEASEPAGSASGDAASETQEGSAQSDTPADTDADVSGPAASFQSLPLQKKAVIPLYISRRISLRRDWSESMNPLAGTRRENRPLRSLQVSRRQAIICGLS